MDLSLGRSDTSVIKGLAILGMLLWHLFFAPNPIGIVFPQVLRFISIVGDFCVSAFLFVSGYGLTISYKNYPNCQLKGWQFVFKRLIRFYSNFWFVFLFFVPIGIFVFDIPMTTEIGTVKTIYIWLKQIFALSGQQSYNSAWWFNTLIVKYYVVFPFLLFMIRKKPIATILFFAFFSMALFYYTRINHIYIVIFIVGIAWAYYRETITTVQRKILEHDLN